MLSEKINQQFEQKIYHANLNAGFMGKKCNSVSKIVE